MTRNDEKPKKQTGVMYVILSAILFGTMPLLACIAYAHGSNAYTVASLINILKRYKSSSAQGTQAPAESKEWIPRVERHIRLARAS